MGLVILILGLLLTACDSPGSETANKPKSTKAEITSFNFGNAKDTVNIDHSKGEITVGLEYTAGINITKLTATLTLSDKAKYYEYF